MLYIDPFSNQILQANKKASALFGINNDELTELTVSQFFNGCLDKLLSFTQQILEQGDAWSNDLFMVINHEKIYLSRKTLIVSITEMSACPHILTLRVKLST